MIYADKYLQSKRFLFVNARQNGKTFKDDIAADKHRE